MLVTSLYLAVFLAFFGLFWSRGLRRFAISRGGGGLEVGFAVLGLDSSFDLSFNFRSFRR